MASDAYAGFGAALAGIFLYKGTTEVVKAVCEPIVGPEAAPIVATLAGGAILFPIDTIRLRMVLDSEEKDAVYVYVC